jgi:hypothetical protein
MSTAQQQQQQVPAKTAKPASAAVLKGLKVATEVKRLTAFVHDLYMCDNFGEVRDPGYSAASTPSATAASNADLHATVLENNSRKMAKKILTAIDNFNTQLRISQQARWTATRKATRGAKFEATKARNKAKVKAARKRRSAEAAARRAALAPSDSEGMHTHTHTHARTHRHIHLTHTHTHIGSDTELAGVLGDTTMNLQ